MRYLAAGSSTVRNRSRRARLVLRKAVALNLVSRRLRVSQAGPARGRDPVLAVPAMTDASAWLALAIWLT